MALLSGHSYGVLAHTSTGPIRSYTSTRRIRQNVGLPDNSPKTRGSLADLLGSAYPAHDSSRQNTSYTYIRVSISFAEAMVSGGSLIKKGSKWSEIGEW